MQVYSTFLKRHQVLNKLRIVACCIVAIYVHGCYDNSDKVVNQWEPQQHFNVEELIHALHLDTLGMKENVVLVQGNIEDINYLNNRNTIILKGKQNSNMSIICDMQEDQARLLDSLEIGQNISIKGILKGSLKDIILLNCQISNPSNE